MVVSALPPSLKVTTRTSGRDDNKLASSATDVVATTRKLQQFSLVTSGDALEMLSKTEFEQWTHNKLAPKLTLLTIPFQNFLLKNVFNCLPKDLDQSLTEGHSGPVPAHVNATSTKRAMEILAHLYYSRESKQEIQRRVYDMMCLFRAWPFVRVPGGENKDGDNASSSKNSDHRCGGRGLRLSAICRIVCNLFQEDRRRAWSVKEIYSATTDVSNRRLQDAVHLLYGAGLIVPVAKQHAYFDKLTGHVYVRSHLLPLESSSPVTLSPTSVVPPPPSTCPKESFRVRPRMRWVWNPFIGVNPPTSRTPPSTPNSFGDSVSSKNETKKRTGSEVEDPPLPKHNGDKNVAKRRRVIPLTSQLDLAGANVFATANAILDGRADASSYISSPEWSTDNIQPLFF